MIFLKLFRPFSSGWPKPNLLEALSSKPSHQTCGPTRSPTAPDPARLMTHLPDPVGAPPTWPDPASLFGQKPTSPHGPKLQFACGPAARSPAQEACFQHFQQPNWRKKTGYFYKKYPKEKKIRKEYQFSPNPTSIFFSKIYIKTSIHSSLFFFTIVNFLKVFLPFLFHYFSIQPNISYLQCSYTYSNYLTTSQHN